MSKLLNMLKNNNCFVYIYILMCTFITSLFCSNNPFSVGYIGTDSSVFNYIARIILKGGMPYRDSFDHKGPLIYLIDTLGQCIHQDFGVWLVEFLFIFVTLIYAYKIARLLGCSNLKSLIVIAINAMTLSYYFEGGNFTEEYACTFITLSLYIFLKFFKYSKVTFFDLLLCGFSFGCVCLLRINMIVLWGVMGVGIFIKGFYKKQYQELTTYTFSFILGITLILIPIILWLMLNNALEPLFEDYFLFNFIYCSHEHWASLQNKLMASIYFLKSPASFLSLPLIAYFFLKKKETVDLMFEFAIVLSIFMLCMGGQAYNHYGMSLVPYVIYAFSRLLSECSYTKKHISIVVITCLFLVLFIKEFYFIFVHNINNYYKSKRMFKMNRLVKIIKNHSNENDKITVCGNGNVIYLLSNRLSSSKYSYQYPIAKLNDDIKNEYIADIQYLDTKIIVKYPKRLCLKDIDKIIEKNYQILENTNLYEVYLHK